MLALRSSSTAAATVAAAGPTNQFAEPPAPRLSCCRRAGRRPRETAAAARRGPSTQTQCTHCAARARRPPTSRPPPQPPRAFSRRRRACATVAARGGTRPPPRPPPRAAPLQCPMHALDSPSSAAAKSRPPKTGKPTVLTAFSLWLLLGAHLSTPGIRARRQVSHISTGPRASPVSHNQHRCGKRRAADALAMLMHRDVGPDPWICGKPAWHNHRPRSECLPVLALPSSDLAFPFFPCAERIDARLPFLLFSSVPRAKEILQIASVPQPGERLNGTKSSLLLAAMPIATPAEKPVIPGPVRASPSRYRPSGGATRGASPTPRPDGHTPRNSVAGV